MYRIIDGRGTGKTLRLMLIAKENRAVFVCSNPFAMREKAECYGLAGITFVSYDEAWKMYQGAEDVKYVVDELECFVKHVMTNAGRMIGYSLSEED